MTFEILLFKLRELLRERVRNGELTERGMARATGVSQPHLHNILKGIRALPPELADQLLNLADLNLQTLIAVEQFASEEFANAQPTPANQVNSTEIERMAEKSEGPLPNYSGHELGPDPSMEPRFRGGDIVYYEEGTRDRTLLDPKGLYLVHFNDRLLVRYLRMGGQRLYLASEETLQAPVRWDYVSLAGGHILEIVRGRIVWICRKVEEAETSAPQEAR
jgi:plasmid maintenance system antidote protein VapI